MHPSRAVSQVFSFAASVLMPLLLTIGASEPARAGYFEIEAVPDGPSDLEARQLARELLSRSELAARLSGKKFRILETSLEPDVRNPIKDGFSEENTAERAGANRFVMLIYDYTDNKLITVKGSTGDPTNSMIEESDDSPPPTEEEFEEALGILRRDPTIGPVLAMGLWSAANAMPPVIEHPTGSPHHGRTIPVALLSRSDRAPHEIVGVNLRTEEILRYPDRAPDDSIAAARTCGPRRARQGSTSKGVTGSTKIIVRRLGEELWNFTAIRPSSSSGYKGSGIELRDVRYKGRLILGRIHMPILNVQYAADKCGPYRDWAYAENPFRASGRSLAPGFIQVAAAPRTIADTGDDYGTFTGVAVHDNGPELVLTSELSAGWYRYVSEFRLHEDGTIRPRIKFAAVENSCVCYSHVHHGYWRLDFDIDQSKPNRLETKTSNGWRIVEREEVQSKGAQASSWRISNPSTGRAYILEPGEGDGRTDRFGQGDAWALAYRSTEIDDARVRRFSKAATLSKFVSGESVLDRDLVFWYAIHFLHEHDDVSSWSVAGPTIRPADL